MFRARAHPLVARGRPLRPGTAALANWGLTRMMTTMTTQLRLHQLHFLTPLRPTSCALHLSTKTPTALACFSLRCSALACALWKWGPRPGLWSMRSGPRAFSSTHFGSPIRGRIALRRPQSSGNASVGGGGGAALQLAAAAPPWQGEECSSDQPPLPAAASDPQRTRARTTAVLSPAASQPCAASFAALSQSSGGRQQGRASACGRGPAAGTGAESHVEEEDFYTWAARKIAAEEGGGWQGGGGGGAAGGSRLSLELAVSAWLADAGRGTGGAAAGPEAPATPNARDALSTAPGPLLGGATGAVAAASPADLQGVSEPHHSSGAEAEAPSVAALIETLSASTRALQSVATRVAAVAAGGASAAAAAPSSPPSPAARDLRASLAQRARAAVHAHLGAFGDDEGRGEAGGARRAQQQQPQQQPHQRHPAAPLHVRLGGEALRTHYLDSDALSEYDAALLELDELPRAAAAATSAAAAPAATAPASLPARGIGGGPALKAAREAERGRDGSAAAAPPRPLSRRVAPAPPPGSTAGAEQQAAVLLEAATHVRAALAAEQQAAVLLEAATHVRAALAARVPGLKKILEPIVGMVMDPVTEQAREWEEEGGGRGEWGGLTLLSPPLSKQVIPTVGDQMKDQAVGGIMASASADVPSPCSRACATLPSLPSSNDFILPSHRRTCSAHRRGPHLQPHEPPRGQRPGQARPAPHQVRHEEGVAGHHQGASMRDLSCRA